MENGQPKRYVLCTIYVECVSEPQYDQGFHDAGEQIALIDFDYEQTIKKLLD